MKMLIIIAFASAAIVTVSNLADFFFVGHDLKATLEYELGSLAGISFFGLITYILDAYKKD